MDAPRYLLDTNALFELIKHPAGILARRIATLDEAAICTSIMVAAELRFGARKKGSVILAAKINELLANVQILPLEQDVDSHYAEIRWHLETTGQPISANDLIIAAHARALDLTLVTANVREFGRIPGLTVENWLGMG